MSGYSFDNNPDTGRALQELARREMRVKLLEDIRIDIAVCQLEGWDYKEYLIGLRDLIDSFIKE